MKVLMTGATGFLGSHLAKGLLRENHEVVIIKRSSSDIFRIEELLPSTVSYDVDRCSISDIMREQAPNVVIHTATNYGRSSEDGMFSRVFRDNVIFPMELLECLPSDSYFVNTDSYFNNGAFYPNDYLSSYRLSKKHFLETARHYAMHKGIYLINARLEHVYGPLDSLSKFTMYIIHKLIDNQSPIELTLGEQQRDFVFVEDVVSAYLTILRNFHELSHRYMEFQIGTGVTETIRHFVELSKKLTRSTSELQFGKLPYRENEILFSQADVQPLKNLGWKPRFSLAEGISAIIRQLNQNG